MKSNGEDFTISVIMTGNDDEIYDSDDDYLNEFREDEEQSEGEEDLEGQDEKLFARAVVSGSDWTTETIIRQIDKGNILLNPDFQRRDAWDKKRKSSFIESLILGLPVPQVVLAESKDRRGSYVVLDGKQRLLSIRQFAAEQGDKEYEQLKLTGLKIRDDLNSNNLESLRANATSSEDVSAFENETVRTIVIKNWPDEDFLYHVFLRLNTGSVPLSTQELRQALHPGPFVSFLDRRSSESNALKEILNLRKPDFRMRDAELLLRYYAFRNYLKDYSGNLKKFLDDACRDINSAWEEAEKDIESQLLDFEKAYIATKKIFGRNSFRKWTGKSYENRFNRSVFDIMMRGFSDKVVRQAVEGRESEVENVFKNLCASEPEFRKSIESTTKSLSATCTRFAAWNWSMNQLCGLSLWVPKIADSKIV